MQIYEQIFSDLILKYDLLELSVGEALAIDIKQYYKDPIAFIPDSGKSRSDIFTSRLDELFFITDIPFITRKWSPGKPLEIEKYGDEFDENEYKYMENIIEWDFDKKKIDWAKNILSKYRIRKNLNKLIKKQK